MGGGAHPYVRLWVKVALRGGRVHGPQAAHCHPPGFISQGRPFLCRARTWGHLLENQLQGLYWQK